MILTESEKLIAVIVEAWGLYVVDVVIFRGGCERKLKSFRVDFDFDWGRRPLPRLL